MNTLGWYNSLTDTQKKWFKYFIIFLVSALLSAGLTYHLCSKHYNAKYEALNEEFIIYKANHPDSDENVREQEIIDKALQDKKNNVPLIAPIGTKETTSIYYTNKTSKDDADVEMESKPTGITVSYNGKKETLPTVNKETQEKTEDGKLVIKQEQAATLDVTSIVNREIANKELEHMHNEEVLKRQKKQQTFWGVVGGVALGCLISR
jgi:hypothetical protein